MQTRQIQAIAGEVQRKLAVAPLAVARQPARRAEINFQRAEIGVLGIAQHRAAQPDQRQPPAIELARARIVQTEGAQQALARLLLKDAGKRQTGSRRALRPLRRIDALPRHQQARQQSVGERRDFARRQQAHVPGRSIQFELNRLQPSLHIERSIGRQRFAMSCIEMAAQGKRRVLADARLPAHAGPRRNQRVELQPPDILCARHPQTNIRKAQDHNRPADVEPRQINAHRVKHQPERQPQAAWEVWQAPE